MIKVAREPNILEVFHSSFGKFWTLHHCAILEIVTVLFSCFTRRNKVLTKALAYFSCPILSSPAQAKLPIFHVPYWKKVHEACLSMFFVNNQHAAPAKGGPKSSQGLHFLPISPIPLCWKVCASRL